MAGTELIYHQKIFEEIIYIKKKNNQCRIWTKQEIHDIINQMLYSKSKNLKEERALQNFHIIEVNDILELRYTDVYCKLNSNKSLRVVPVEDLYNKISWCWEQIGFGGWKPLHSKIKEQGYYINVELVKIFLSQNPSHQSRINKQTQKSLVTKPILSDSFGERGQVDLIDMRTTPDGEYNWILNYQDHFTKWIVLRPLKKKCAEEVTISLIKIFYTLGAPNILQSDNGKEFDNKYLLTSLNRLWPSSKIIHGKPRYPQSQGSVESANKRTENILASLLEKNQHSNWANELDKVAYMKNSCLHSACKCSPYKMLYGRDPPRGLRDYDVPEALENTINTVEELQLVNPGLNLESEFSENPRNNEIINNEVDVSMLNLSPMTEINKQSILDESLNSNNSEIYDIKMNFDPESLGATSYNLPQAQICQDCNFSVGHECIYCNTCNSVGHKKCFNRLSPMKGESRLSYFCSQSHCLIDLNRKKTCLIAQRGQKRQAECMLSNTAKKLPIVMVGDNVRVPIPKEDRGKLGPKHVLGVVTNISNSFYCIGTRFGTLDRKYTRGEFYLWSGSSYLRVSDISETEIKMRNVAKLVSLGSKNSCKCRGNCANNHCACRMNGYPCSSGCHPKQKGKCCNNDQVVKNENIHDAESKSLRANKRKNDTTGKNSRLLKNMTERQYKKRKIIDKEIMLSSQEDVEETFDILSNNSFVQENSENWIDKLENHVGFFKILF